jgi:hypothetical protein
MRRTTAVAFAALLAAGSGPAASETLLRVDASAPPPAIETGYLKLGTATAPDGAVIGVNSRYLTLDGKPWLPVMGEFHYSRFPAQDWDAELAKMKAAGVDIVSTYVIWIHHEEVAGRFDWSGQRDLRRFIELCRKHGLKVVLRLGPWSHAEVRYGGHPDWVVDQTPTRSDDPVYMAEVERFWSEIAAQAKGLLWKDGGPVIGVQLENEYNLTGPGRGREHMASLKRLALKLGFDVPLYTATGWDGTVYPSREFAPVQGGYPDEPWGVSTAELPPKETYAFRFDSRVSGNLGALTKQTAPGDSDPDIPHTPFLGAEFGGGVPTMYRRRPVLTADDVAAMLPVELGSGVNLYGYYMFHGGVNPQGRTTLQESTAIGGYNDLPRLDYDFQAPFGAFGQAHPVLNKVRPWHYFLEAFGADLAPMVPHRPEAPPRALDDLTTPRFSVRSLGDSGFLFVNNHVRQHPMAEQRGVRFQVRLPGGPLAFPSKPIDIPTDAYFVWPFNLELGDARLAWATAQPVTRIETDAGPTFVFRAVDGVPAEFAFTGAAAVSGPNVRVAHDDAGRLLVDGLKPGAGELLTVRPRTGRPVRILLLSEAEAERLWIADLDGRRRLVLTDCVLWQDGADVELRSRAEPGFRLAVYPTLATPAASLPLHAAGRDGVFQLFEAQAAPRAPTARLTPLRAAQPVPPIAIGGPAKAALEPAPEVFGSAAAWTIGVPRSALDGAAEVYLDIRYKGDVGRLFSGPNLLDDDFWNGATFEVGLKRFADLLARPLTFTVLPIRSDAPIYLDAAARAALPAQGQTAEVDSVSLVPEYALRLGPER